MMREPAQKPSKEEGEQGKGMGERLEVSEDEE